MGDGLKKPAPEQAKPKSGLSSLFGGILEGVAAGLARSSTKGQNPADPSARMAPVREDREETGREMVFRATEGQAGQAPMVRVDRQRQYVARAVAGKAGAHRSSKIPQGTGSPLAAPVQGRMQQQLGHDLSAVRVHTSGESATAAKDFGARAFTVGNDVHFNDGEFAPGSKEGDKLLAHELTHVVQGQKSGIQRKAEPQEKEEEKKEDAGAEAAGNADAKNEGGDDVEVSDPAEPAEKEADAVADQAADSLHGDGAKGGDEKDAKKEQAPPIAAKLNGVGFKILRAEAPNGGGGPSPQEQSDERSATWIVTNLRRCAADPSDSIAGNILVNRARQIEQWRSAYPNNTKIKEAVELFSQAKEQVQNACNTDVQTLSGALAAIDPVAPDAGDKLTAIRSNPLLAKWRSHFLLGAGRATANPALTQLLAQLGEVEAKIREEAQKRQEQQQQQQQGAPQQGAPQQGAPQQGAPQQGGAPQQPAPTGPGGVPAPGAQSASQQVPAAGQQTGPLTDQQLQLQRKLDFCRAKVQEAAKAQELKQKFIDLTGGKLTDVGLATAAAAIVASVFVGPLAPFAAAAGLIVAKLIKEAVAIPLDGLNASVDKVRESNVEILNAGIEAATPEQLDQLVDVWGNEPITISDGMQQMSEILQVQVSPDKIWDEMNKDVEMKKILVGRGKSTAFEVFDKIWQWATSVASNWVPGAEDVKKAKDVWKVYQELKVARDEIKLLKDMGVAAPPAAGGPPPTP